MHVVLKNWIVGCACVKNISDESEWKKNVCLYNLSVQHANRWIASMITCLTTDCTSVCEAQFASVLH